MGLTTKEISSSSFNDMISSVDRRSEYVENRAEANVRLNNFLTPYTLDDKSSILNAPCGYSNGVYASLRPVQTFGPELSVNGDFATDSDWTKGTNWSIANGKATVTNSTTSSIFQDILNVSKKYKVTFEITEITSGSLRIGIGQNFSDYFTQVGTYTYYGKIFLDTLLRINPSSGTNASIDNVSVKEVIDADFDFTRGSAATRVTKDGLIKNVQILSGELVQNGDFEEIGSELVVNGDFATDSNWTKGIGWSISGGKAIKTSGTGSALSQTVPTTTVGKIYKFTFDAIVTSGVANATIYGVTIPVFSTSGTQEHTITATSTSGFEFYAASNFDGSIDNVSVKEVGQNWEFGTGWSIEDNNSNQVAKFIGSAANEYLRQDNVYTPGDKIRLQFTLSNFTSGQFRVISTGVVWSTPVINATNGTFTYDIDTTGTSNGHIYLQAVGGSFNGYVDDISVIKITDDTDLPRIDYTNGTGSLLLEPQSTNTATYSNDFTQGSIFNQSADPSLGASVLTQNQEKAPDGTNNGWLLKDNNNSGTGPAGLQYFSARVNSDDFNTISIFAKKALSNDFLILETASYDVSAIGRSYFNISNGSLGNISTSHTAKIEDYGNGWYRCSITFQTTTDVQGAIYVRLASSNGQVNITRDGTNGVYIFGLQCEADATQNYATSYIPTEGSTVTRNADVCNNAGSSDLINSTEGVLYAEISSFKNGGIGDRTISISDGSTQNAIQLLLHNTANRINFRLRSGGSLDVNISDFTFEQNQINKIACKYKSGDYALWVNGEERATSTSSSLPSGLSVLAFDDGSLNDFYGNVRSVAVFKEALTDEELAKITSTTQQEAFYEMRDKMLQIDADYYEFGDYTTRLKKLF